MNDWMNPEGTPEKRAALLLAEMGDEEKLTQLQCLFARIPDDGMIAEQCPWAWATSVRCACGNA